jgi:uncharacterized delta-60 repeat protein
MIKMGICRSVLLVLITMVPFVGSAQICPGAPGCLDPTFGNSGTKLVVMASNPGNTSQRDAIIQSDGKIVSLVDNRYTLATLIRLNTDGTLDTSFGSGGIVSTNWHYANPAPYGYANGLAIQNVSGQERLVVAGSWTVPQGRNTVVTMLRVDRYLPNGSIDTSFGTNGTVLVNKPSAQAVAIQPGDQKIVTVGTLEAVVRLNANGTIDTSFGPNGDGATGAGLAGWSVKALPDGKLLFGGDYNDHNSTLMAVSRLNANGSIDVNFGSSGRALANFFGSGSFGRGFHVDLDPFGNIIAGGIARPKGASIVENYFAAARFTSTGQPDTSFNGSGMAVYNFGGVNSSARGIVAQSDGKVIVTGGAGATAGTSDFGLVRLNYNGTIDSVFGMNGRVLTDIDGSDYSYSVGLWTDPTCMCEKIVMAGSSSAGASFARYLTQ